MISLHSVNSTPALKSKKPTEKKKGLALRDITNQTPVAKTLKKSKKPVTKTLKKTPGQAKIPDVEKVEKSVNINDIEYMPPRVTNPIQYSNCQYEMDHSSVKPTSRGCIYTKFKLIPDEFEAEEIVFNSVDDLKVAEINDDFLYF